MPETPEFAGNWLESVGSFIVAVATGVGLFFAANRRNKTNNAKIKADQHEQIVTEYRELLSSQKNAIAQQREEITHLNKQVEILRKSQIASAVFAERVKAQLYDMYGQIEHLKTIAEGLPVVMDATIVADSDGNIVEWNAGATVLFHWTSTEVLGKSITMLIPERYLEKHTMAWNDIKVSKRLPKHGPHHVHGLVRDGKEIPLSISYAGWESNDKQFFAASMRLRKDTGMLGPCDSAPSQT